MYAEESRGASRLNTSRAREVRRGKNQELRPGFLRVSCGEARGSGCCRVGVQIAQYISFDVRYRPRMITQLNGDTAPDPSPRWRQQHQQQQLQQKLRQGGTYRPEPPPPARSSMSTAAAITGRNLPVRSCKGVRLRQGWRLVRPAGLWWWFGGVSTVVSRARTRASETTVDKNRVSSLPPLHQKRRRGRARQARNAWSLLVLFVSWWSSSDVTIINSAVFVQGASVSVGFGGGCPNACSGHGYCTDSSTETCTCHQGWTGGDCSIRESFCVRLDPVIS